METINRAFEGADAFKKMMEKATNEEVPVEMFGGDLNIEIDAVKRFSAISPKMRHENRAQYRARIKRERRNKVKA